MPPGHQTKLTPMGPERSWLELQPNSATVTEPSIRQRQLVFETPYQNIYHVTAEFNDFVKEYYVNEHGARAGLVVVREGQILLVRQYRLLIDRVSWEIPGGQVDDRETPEVAAVRECLEETGVRCRNPQPLIFYHLSLDTQYNPTHLFYSTEMVEESQSIDTHEVNGREWVPLPRCIEMIFEQQIVDSFSIVALFAYQMLVSQHTGLPKDGAPLR